MDTKQTAKPNKPGLAWFLGLNALFLLLAAILGFWLARLMEQGGLEAVEAWLRQITPWFTAIRITLLAALVAGWPRTVTGLAKRHGWPQAREAFMLGLRWRVALWLLASELLLGQNGLAVLAKMTTTP